MAFYAQALGYRPLEPLLLYENCISAMGSKINFFRNIKRFSQSKDLASMSAHAYAFAL